MRIATPRSLARRVLVALGFTGSTLGSAGCSDPGLERRAYCRETIVAPPGGDCSVDYVVCSGSFACSWRVECPAGAASCSCAASDPGAGCQFSASFPSDGYCDAAARGDRARIREIAVPPCLQTSVANVDFSQIP